jgi:acylphosphatase
MCGHYKIKVTGKVQGVWFRKYTYHKATELELFGFVQNEPDGSVYIEAESMSTDKLEIFVKWLYTGSPLSKVETLKVDRYMQCKKFSAFQINR